MVTWAELSAVAPEIAVIGRELLEQNAIAYLATVRRDGSPRVHPVAPFIIDGRLFVATPSTSPKAVDQTRDGRYMLHMMPGKDDAEFSIRGHARLLEPGAMREKVVDQGPHWVKQGDKIFEYDIEEALSAYWVHVGQPGTYPVRSRWPMTPSSP